MPPEYIKKQSIQFFELSLLVFTLFQTFFTFLKNPFYNFFPLYNFYITIIGFLLIIILNRIYLKNNNLYIKLARYLLLFIIAILEIYIAGANSDIYLVLILFLEIQIAAEVRSIKNALYLFSTIFLLSSVIVVIQGMSTMYQSSAIFLGLITLGAIILLFIRYNTDSLSKLENLEADIENKKIIKTSQENFLSINKNILKEEFAHIAEILIDDNTLLYETYKDSVYMQNLFIQREDSLKLLSLNIDIVNLYEEILIIQKEFSIFYDARIEYKIDDKETVLKDQNILMDREKLRSMLRLIFIFIQENNILNTTIEIKTNPQGVSLKIIFPQKFTTYFAGKTINQIQKDFTWSNILMIYSKIIGNEYISQESFISTTFIKI